MAARRACDAVRRFRKVIITTTYDAGSGYKTRAL